jgi:DNA-directed RNA polymerase subunit omega
MARITSEDAVAQIGNRYDLILVASARVRELRNGHAPMVTKRGGAVLTALREIEQKKIGLSYLNKVDPGPQKKNQKKYK